MLGSMWLGVTLFNPLVSLCMDAKGSDVDATGFPAGASPRRVPEESPEHVGGRDALQPAHQPPLPLRVSAPRDPHAQGDPPRRDGLQGER
eukprot:2849618-Pyramimonas_sp.AAC.1